MLLKINVYAEYKRKNGATEFKETNQLPTKKKEGQPVATYVLKYWKGTSLFSENECFISFQNGYNNRSDMTLHISLRKINLGQKSSLSVGQSI